jgi:hypothetical protein
MNRRITLAAAGNTLAPALAVLRELGYAVSRHESEERLLRAENQTCVFLADDPLLLLGLVKLYEVRGEKWRPSDAEVDDLLGLGGDDA